MYFFDDGTKMRALWKDDEVVEELDLIDNASESQVAETKDGIDEENYQRPNNSFEEKENDESKS